MATAINMPQVGQDIETAVILEWRVKEKDTVKKGDIVALVESDKATFEVESFVSGTVLSLLYNTGDSAPVLQPITYVGEPGENVEQPERDFIQKDIKPVKSDEPQAVRQKFFASPSAKRVAREHGVDLSAVSGSGPRGRIQKRDVLAVVETASKSVTPGESPDPYAAKAVRAPLPAEEDQVLPFSKMRRRIADRLTLSKQTIPHFYLFSDVDLTVILAWRQAYNQGKTERITVNDLIVKAVAAVLREFPRLNAHVDPDKLIQKASVHIGVAVSTEDGLVVPVLENADRMSLDEIHTRIKEMAEKARRGVMAAGENSTFTVSNLGMYAVDKFLPVINPPECAILAVGRSGKKVVARSDGSIRVQNMVTLTLACDHRAVDGAYAAQFLDRLKDRLEKQAG
ncbi:2-oxo acid dehydrogenase subunit E2 [candidate division KSB1 bacterium]|nr:2-oxo acid dehydrogenase subunit E2 [candidate division KSB1 bacterium]